MKACEGLLTPGVVVVVVAAGAGPGGGVLARQHVDVDVSVVHAGVHAVVYHVAQHVDHARAEPSTHRTFTWFASSWIYSLIVKSIIANIQTY